MIFRTTLHKSDKNTWKQIVKLKVERYARYKCITIIYNAPVIP